MSLQLFRLHKLPSKQFFFFPFISFFNCHIKNHFRSFPNIRSYSVSFYKRDYRIIRNNEFVVFNLNFSPSAGTTIFLYFFHYNSVFTFNLFISFFSKNKNITPRRTANHKVAILIIIVEATASSLPFHN